MASFKSYCRHQGHIEGAAASHLFRASLHGFSCRGIEIFDAAFFNIPDQDREGWLQQLVNIMEDLLAFLCIAWPRIFSQTSMHDVVVIRLVARR